MAEDVFGSDQTTANPQEGSPSTAATEDLLKQIVNEDGSQKYKSVEDAFGALRSSQEHIPKIEAENTQLRAEVDKRMTAEQVLEKIKAERKPDETPSPVVDSEALDVIVDKRLEARTLAEKSKANEDFVQTSLTSKWGEKAKEVAANKAKELGMSTEDLRELSQKSPQAALTMLGLASEPQESVPARLAGSVNTESLAPSGKKNYAWYQDLRRKDPAEYRRQYTTMMSDAAKPDFYN
jgi:hypothetical protein